MLLQPEDRRVFLAVLRAAEIVGRRSAADPEADFDRPGPKPFRLRFPFEFERADEASGALKLVESQKPQRVAHDDREARAFEAGIVEPTPRDGEGGEAQIGLGLAAAGREEEQVDDRAGRDGSDRRARRD